MTTMTANLITQPSSHDDHDRRRHSYAHHHPAMTTMITNLAMRAMMDVRMTMTANRGTLYGAKMAENHRLRVKLTLAGGDASA
jgi:hypothetical protein